MSLATSDAQPPSPAPLPPVFESFTFRERYTGRLPEWLLSRLEALGFVRVTRVQAAALETLLPSPHHSDESSSDAVVMAETGSGKTLSYLLPMLARVHPRRAAVQGLILVPTPELGVQVARVARRLAAGYRADARTTPVDRQRLLVSALLTSSSVARQRKMLRGAPPTILVGTAAPVHALATAGALRLHSVVVAVIDEVDANLLSPDNRQQLHEVLTEHCISRIGEPRRTVFASATVPQHRHFVSYAVQQKWLQPTARLVTVGTHDAWNGLSLEAVMARGAAEWATAAASPASSLPPGITHWYALCRAPNKKLKALAFLIREALHRQPHLRMMVFCHRSRPLDTIADYLHQWQVVAPERLTILREDLGKRARRTAIEGYRTGAQQVLLTTDVAARGLDIPETTHVINFDLPPDADTYLHRAGRTGRIGRGGIALSLVVPGEQFVVDRFANRLGIAFQPMEEAFAPERGTER